MTASPPTETREQTRLRRVAESLIAQGQAPPTRGWEVGTDALALLYRLASDLDSSADALAVLHELQVHQVELDLQLEQLENNEQELSAELQRYRQRYEQAPVGYFLIRRDGSVIESNDAAGRLLQDIGDEAGSGSEPPRIDQLICPADRPVLAAMLQQLSPGQGIASCEVRAVDKAADAPALRITARLEPGSEDLWLIVS